MRGSGWGMTCTLQSEGVLYRGEVKEWVLEGIVSDAVAKILAVGSIHFCCRA